MVFNKYQHETYHTVKQIVIFICLKYQNTILVGLTVRSGMPELAADTDDVITDVFL